MESGAEGWATEIDARQIDPQTVIKLPSPDSNC